MAQTPEQLSQGAACYKNLDINKRLGAIIYLANTGGLTYNQISEGAACFYGIDQNKVGGVLIYIYNILTGKNLTADQISEQSICYDSIPLPDQQSVVITELNTGALTFQQIQTNSICFDNMDYGRQMQAWAYVAWQVLNPGITINKTILDQLMTNSACYAKIGMNKKWSAIIFLLNT